MVTHEVADEQVDSSSRSGYDSENAQDENDEMTPLFTGDGTKRLHSETEIADVSKKHRKKGRLNELRKFFKEIGMKGHWDKMQ